MTSRDHLLSRLAERIISDLVQRPVIVAIDGVDAAGKTTFSSALASVIRDAGTDVYQVSIDGFHNPASVRHARAATAPALSYYEDSFDYEAFRTCVIDPVRQPAPHSVTPRVFDHVSDSAVHVDDIHVGDASIVLVDGIFLGRPELAESWDLWVYLHVDRKVARAQGVERDRALFGPDTLDRYLTRYEPGQSLYLEAADPMTHADVVIDNTNHAEPHFLRQDTTLGD